MQRTTSISDATLDMPIEGVNLRGKTLREELGTQPTLLVFVRHFGCIFCREMIADIGTAVQRNPAYPPVLFFYQGTAEQGKEFFPKYWDKARAVADLPKHFYTAFGIENGSIGQLFGPEVWACGMRAAAKGHFVGTPVGDPMTMPGVLLVHRNQILWRHHFRHVGDHPDFDALPSQLQSVLVA